MNFITFTKTYLKDNAIITIVENDIDIIYEGTIKDLENNTTTHMIYFSDIATRRIKNIELGEIQDIIIYLDD